MNQPQPHEENVPSGFNFPPPAGQAPDQVARRDPRIEDYLDQVYAPLVNVVPYARRQELRAELRGHLDARAASYRELGSAPETVSEQALRQFGDPRELARRCADEWRRGSPGRASPPVWPALLVALGCFSLLESISRMLTVILGAPGSSSGREWLMPLVVLLTLLAGLTTGLVAPARPVKGALLALLLLPLLTLATKWTMVMHGYGAAGHGAGLEAAGQALRFLAGTWVRQYRDILLPVGAYAALGCVGAALGGRLRARLAFTGRRRLLQ